MSAIVIIYRQGISIPVPRLHEDKFHEDRLATKDTKMTKFPVCISGGDKLNARFFRSPFEYL